MHRPMELHALIAILFKHFLYQACELSLNLVNLPEAIKMEHLLLELASEQNPLALQFYKCLTSKLTCLMGKAFFDQAVALQFIQPAAKSGNCG